MGPKPLKLCTYVCVGLFLFPVTALTELNGDMGEAQYLRKHGELLKVKGGWSLDWSRVSC